MKQCDIIFYKMKGLKMKKIFKAALVAMVVLTVANADACTEKLQESSIYVLQGLNAHNEGDDKEAATLFKSSMFALIIAKSDCDYSLRADLNRKIEKVKGMIRAVE